MVQNAVFSLLSLRRLCAFVSICCAWLAAGCDFTKALQKRRGQEKVPLVSQMDCWTDELVFSGFYCWNSGSDEQLYGTHVWCSSCSENPVDFDYDGSHSVGCDAAEPVSSLGKSVLDCLRTDSLHIDFHGFVCLYLVSQLLASLRFQILNKIIIQKPEWDPSAVHLRPHFCCAQRYTASPFTGFQKKSCLLSH